VTLPPEPVWVDADPDRIAQVVTNLVHNATRYTPPGGRVTVTVVVSGAEAHLSVTDTGVGLAYKNRERVFDMFTQVSGPGSGGLGIGLALVRGIVELHGGHVAAHSEGLGRGSEFRVALPLATAPAEVSVAIDEPVVQGTARSVLVVDDNEDSAEMMGALLALHGHRVRIAHDAEHALAAAREFAPDAALLDIGLPGLDGYELARQLRQDQRTRHVQLIALTGWGADGDRLRAGEAGFDLHLTKPADPRVVLRALARGRAPAQAAAAPAPAAPPPSVPTANRSGQPPSLANRW
jgi:CheY-like chemotaxis protein